MATIVRHSLIALTDPNGVPYSGANLTIYAAGTTTKLTVYSDDGLSVQADNPIVCDSSGVCPLRFIANAAYKIVATTSSGASLSQYSGDNIDPGIPLGSGVLSIANGGTGASTAGAALTALGGATAEELAEVSAEVASLSGAQASTEKTHIATGTTGQRTGSPTAGDIRHNTTDTKYEGYISDGWDNFMMEADNAASTSDIGSESSGAKYIRPDRLSSSQRVAKAWGRITTSTGTPVLTDGFNISASITDHGAGEYTFSFSTALSSANYSVVATAHRSAGAAVVTINSATTSGFRVLVVSMLNVAVDADAISFVVFGDLS